MSGLQISQQYTTCESARQHFHHYKAGQWEGPWSRFPKRPILAYSTYKSANVKLIHKQVLHKCESSKDLITKQVNSPTRGPLCLQNGKHSGRRKDSHRNPLGEKNHFELVLQCVKGTLVQLGALCCFPSTENYPVAPASPGSPLCAWRSIQEVREENERTPTG